jgi:hypothetical protein
MNEKVSAANDLEWKVCEELLKEDFVV